MDVQSSAERYALRVLAWMCEQYLEERGTLDHMCMSDGERAVELLFHYGFVDSRGRDAEWTQEGRRLLEEPVPMFD